MLGYFLHEYSEIGIHLNLIFSISKQNLDKLSENPLISQKCLDIPLKMSGN